MRTEKIARIADRWGIDRSTVAYVGGHPSDTVDAHRAGVVAVAAAWSAYADLEDLAGQGTDMLFDSVGSFARWVDRAVPLDEASRSQAW